MSDAQPGCLTEIVQELRGRIDAGDEQALARSGAGDVEEVALATSAVLGLYLTESEVPQRFAASIVELTDNRFLVLILLNVMLLIVGMILHGAAAIILITPIVLPLVHQIGLDPVQFGIILTLNIAIGQQTPPVASVLVTACSIARADIWQTTRTNVPFIILLIGVLLLVTYVPFVSLGLVEAFYR